MSSASPSAAEVPGPAPARKGWSSRALLSAPARYLALAVMLASAVFPVRGLGFDLCVLHATTGLPCPGCGMSRALSAFTQGDFTAALGLNPFVLVVWPTFLVLALLTLLPTPLYRRFESWVLARDASIARGYRLAVYAFIAFGVARFAAFAAMGQHFP